MNYLVEGEWGKLFGVAGYVSELKPETVKLLNGASGLVPIDFSKGRTKAMADWLYDCYKLGLFSQEEYDRVRIDVIKHQGIDFATFFKN